MNEKIKNIIAIIFTAIIVVVLLFQIFTPKEQTEKKKTAEMEQSAHIQSQTDVSSSESIGKKTAAELEAREKELLEDLRLLNIEIAGQTSLIHMDELQSKRDKLIEELADIDAQQEQQKNENKQA